MNRSLHFSCITFAGLIVVAPALAQIADSSDDVGSAYESIGADDELSAMETHRSSEPAQATKTDDATLAATIVKTWDDLLANATYLRYELDVVRSYRNLSVDEEKDFDYLTLLDRPYGEFPADDDEQRQGWAANHVALHAEVVMGRDCLFLNVWRRDESGEFDRDHPVVTLAFHDGQVHERVWFPGVLQYRTLHYDSQTEWGPGDLNSSFAEGCMIGASLWTWVGDTAHNEWFRAAMELEATLLPGPFLNANDCKRVLRRGTSLETEQDGESVLIHRTQDFYFNAAGERVRWRDATFAEHQVPGRSSIILVDSKFDFTFMEELPEDVQDYLASVGD